MAVAIGVLESAENGPFSSLQRLMFAVQSKSAGHGVGNDPVEAGAIAAVKGGMMDAGQEIMVADFTIIPRQ